MVSVPAMREGSGSQLWTWARPDRGTRGLSPSCAGGEGGRAGLRGLSGLFQPGVLCVSLGPRSLTMARHKVPSSGTTCPLSQMAPMKDPRGAKLTPTDSNSRGEGTGGWEGEHTSCQWT